MQLSLAAAAFALLVPGLAQAQTAIGSGKGPPTFFVTSAGAGKGADLGGLAGADRHCQALATAAGIGAHVWRAYLSTQAAPGSPAVNARDRIGRGPWFNVAGYRIAADLADLHGDTLEAARNGNLVSQATALTEKGEIVAGEGDKPKYHDVLTGSRSDGRAYRDKADHTCSNWTSSATSGSAQIGHTDRNTRHSSISWNSAHRTLGCSLDKLAETGGGGYLYCFAAEPRLEGAEAAGLARRAMAPVNPAAGRPTHTRP